jgi:hypothetical protein
VRWWIAFAAVVLAWAWPMQSVGCGQNAHYAAVKSFAEGHPDVDRYAQETCDLVRRDGHFYAAKGPALDFWSVPWYLALRTVGAVPPNRNEGEQYPAAMTGVPLRAIWQIGLWAVVLPGAALLLLLRRLADRVEPGTGATAAVLFGLGTLAFPFATLLFAHVPAALLGFAAFALLFLRRSAILAAHVRGSRSRPTCRCSSSPACCSSTRGGARLRSRSGPCSARRRCSPSGCGRSATRSGSRTPARRSTPAPAASSRRRCTASSTR